MPFEFREPLQAGLVSIVIPCYNAARYLVDTLESAFTQTYTPTEIIVIDDGSTDDFAALIRAHGNRVKSEFGPNRGAAAARNRGTALTRGEFIQYLDADDLLMPDATEKRVAALQRSAADVAYSDWETLIESKPEVFEISARVTKHIEEFHASTDMAILNGFWAALPSLTYRRSIVERFGGWQEGLEFAEDGRFMMDAALVGARFIHVPGVGARVRLHPTSLSHRVSEAAFAAAAFRNAIAFQNAFEAKGHLNQEQRCAIARMYNYVARSLFFHDRRAFRDCMERLYEVEPGFQLTWPKVAQLTSSLVGFEGAGRLLAASVALRRTVRHAAKILREGGSS